MFEFDFSQMTLDDSMLLSILPEKWDVEHYIKVRSALNRLCTSHDVNKIPMSLGGLFFQEFAEAYNRYMQNDVWGTFLSGLEGNDGE